MIWKGFIGLVSLQEGMEVKQGPVVEKKLESVVPDLTWGSVIYKPCDLEQVP